MNIPEWFKPALYGAAVGAVALALVGFSWGGWVTGGTADKLAADQARAEVVAALVPVCLQQSKQDPQIEAAISDLRNASSYQRSELLMKTGWATMPGSTQPNRAVAKACLKIISEQF